MDGRKEKCNVCNKDVERKEVIKHRKALTQIHYFVARK
jgi:hypothetical protein